MNTLWQRFVAWLFDREPTAQALSSAIASSGYEPTTAFIPEPPAAMVSTYVHAGKRFERLSEARQEQAQRELYLRLKAKQRADELAGIVRREFSELDVRDEPVRQAA